MKKSVFRVVSAVIPFVLFAATALAAEPAKEAPPKPKPEPAYLSLKFQKLGGGETTLKQALVKENNLLVFFQSACIACGGELKALKEAYGDNAKVEVIGIGVDVRPDQLKKFVDEIGFPKVVLLDSAWNLGPEFMVSYTPAVVMLDKAGERLAVVGGFTPKTMETIKSKLK